MQSIIRRIIVTNLIRAIELLPLVRISKQTSHIQQGLKNKFKKTKIQDPCLTKEIMTQLIIKNKCNYADQGRPADITAWTSQKSNFTLGNEATNKTSDYAMRF